MATYNQILRQRRMNLNLTIEDVSAQTRLAPEYIQAIEQHNLDAFSDDYSFARYFVHAYCDAIGVNWAVVQNEVDADISAYARQRQMALTLAQQRIVDEMESVTVEEEPEPEKKKPKRRFAKNFQKRVSRMFQNLEWTHKRTFRIAIVVALAFIGVSSVINLVMDFISDRQTAAIQAQQQQELKEKEEETAKLAEQKKTVSDAQLPVITRLNREDNVFQAANVIEGTQRLTISVTHSEGMRVAIYRDGELAAGSEYDTLSGDFITELTITSECEISINIGNYNNNEIEVGGHKISFSKTKWTADEDAVVTVVVHSNDNVEAEDSRPTLPEEPEPAEETTEVPAEEQPVEQQDVYTEQPVDPGYVETEEYYYE